MADVRKSWFNATFYNTNLFRWI